MELFLFLGGIFLFTFIFGILLEKVRIPWIFAALILGLGGAFTSFFKIFTSSEIFQFLAWLGMYFLLFLIGFELEIEKIKKLGKFIIKSTFFIIFFEALFGSFLIHFLFGYPWLISVLVALSFATVGEAVLIPILDEFKLTKTKLGQVILGIGTFDDIIEVFLIIFLVLSLPYFLGNIPQMSAPESGKILYALFYLIILFLITFGIIELRKRVSRMKVKDIEAIFLLVLAIFFLLLGIGRLAEASALGALLAGLAVKNFLPSKRIEAIESEIKSLSYGFFGPIFFFWVGTDIDIDYLIKYPLLIILVTLVSYGAKILASWLVAQKELGKKESLFLGLSLGVRFSTSIVIIKFLFEKNLIGQNLYSVLIGSSMVFIFIPFFLSFLIQKWHLNYGENNS
jgi:Ca2+-transporting ATPase